MIKLFSKKIFGEGIQHSLQGQIAGGTIVTACPVQRSRKEGEKTHSTKFLIPDHLNKQTTKEALDFQAGEN